MHSRATPAPIPSSHGPLPLPSSPPSCQVTREVFEAAKGRLKVVGRAGVGVDNVDLGAATEVCSGMRLHGRWPLRHACGEGVRAQETLHAEPLVRRATEQGVPGMASAVALCSAHHAAVLGLYCSPLQYGCLVVNAPTANTVAAAEHGIALLCALSRNVAQADSSMKQGAWERTKYVGVSLVGKVLAIIGFGKVSWPVRVWCAACQQAGGSV